MGILSFKPVSVLACILTTSVLLVSCAKIADAGSSASPSPPVPAIPPLESDITISFPAAQMKVFHNGAEVGVESGGTKTATLPKGSPGEISITYTIAEGETVYDVVATKNNVGGGVNIAFVLYDSKNIVKYILKEDTDFSVKTIMAKDDEKFENTSVFSTGKYAPVTTPYKVRINLVGNSSEIFETVKYWFEQGNNERKNGYVFSKGTSDDKTLNGFLKDTKDEDQSANYAPHVAIMNFGQAEAKAETFDAATFETEYKALVSYVKSIKNSTRSNFTPKVVLMSLAPNVTGKNATAVNSSIKKVAEQTGSVFFDIAGIKSTAESVYNTKRKVAVERAVSLGFSNTCTQGNNCKLHSASSDSENYTNRKLAEELFFSFYFDIEEIATPNQKVSTTPTNKWGANDNGNQDSTKRTLITTVKNKGVEKYPQVIFTGDSITDFFDGSKSGYGAGDLWLREVGYDDSGNTGTGTSTKYRALNLGNGGDFTQSLLYRWQNISDDTASGAYTGAFDFSESVKVISLLIGTNNIAPNKITNASESVSQHQERPLSATETVKGQEEVIKVLKAKFPNAKILLMAVYPRGTNNPWNTFIDFTRLQVMAINRMLYEKYGNGQDPNVIFVDTYEDYLKDCGCQFEKYFHSNSDNVHPAANAYLEIWLPTVQPIFDKYVVGGAGPASDPTLRAMTQNDIRKGTTSGVDSTPNVSVNGNLTISGAGGYGVHMLSSNITHFEGTTNGKNFAFIVAGDDTTGHGMFVQQITGNANYYFVKSSGTTAEDRGWASKEINGYNHATDLTSARFVIDISGNTVTAKLGTQVIFHGDVSSGLGGVSTWTTPRIGLGASWSAGSIGNVVFTNCKVK